MTASDHQQPIKRRRHLRGSLRLEGATWINRYLGAEGREQRMVIGSRAQYPTKAAARVEADRRMVSINPSLTTGARSVTVAAFAEVYLADACDLMKPSAAKAARSLLRAHIVPVLGHLHLEQIAGRWPQMLVNAMRAQNLSNRSITNALTVLSRMVVLARRYGVPCADFRRSMIKMPPAQVSTPRRFYTPAEATQIITAAEWPWCVLFALYAHSGIRPGEGLALKWPHINVTDHVIHIRENAVARVLGTVKSIRSRADLPMSPAICRMLEQYRVDWIPNDLGLLFADDHGQPWHGDYVRRHVMAPLLRRLGLPHGALHGWRHGLITALLNDGTAISTVQSIARHIDVRTTASYAHSVVTDQRLAIDRISALIPTGGSRRSASDDTQEKPA